MRILVDFQIFFLQRFGGISRYHSNVNHFINSEQNLHHSTILNLGCNNAYVECQVKGLKRLQRKGTYRLLNFINRQATRFEIGKFDVFHPSYYNPYFLSFKKLPPYVVTIHDMIPEHYFKQSNRDLIEAKKLIVSKASSVIAISEATKNEMVKMYDINPDLIHVIYHGYTDFIKTPELRLIEENDKQTQPYLLFIGHRDYYKNFTYFVKAASDFLKLNNVRLNVIGFPPSVEELRTINELGIKDHVSFIHHVSEAQLYHYYNKALCFVFPSIAEGFGIPLLESFAAQCPVICTDIPIFREIGGDAAIYFKLDDDKSLLNCLESVLRNPSLRETMINRGLTRFQKFQWKENALKTLDAYKSALGN